MRIISTEHTYRKMRRTRPSAFSAEFLSTVIRARKAHRLPFLFGFFFFSFSVFSNENNWFNVPTRQKRLRASSCTKTLFRLTRVFRRGLLKNGLLRNRRADLIMVCVATTCCAAEMYVARVHSLGHFKEKFARARRYNILYRNGEERREITRTYRRT